MRLPFDSPTCIPTEVHSNTPHQASALEPAVGYRRWVLALQYDGTGYHGWQKQNKAGLATIQETLEAALSKVANHLVKTVCAARTDASVHAMAQVVHFDTDADREETVWVMGTNAYLPRALRVLWVKCVTSAFHARFSAVARRYRYVLYNHPIRPSLLRHLVGWHYYDLNEERMSAAARYLLGEHDFTAFRGSACQAKHARRTVQDIQVYRQQQFLLIEIQANAFLLHMVRNIVGTLLLVGSGKKEVEWMEQVLNAQDRRRAGATMSPQGLYLTAVYYPATFALPELSTDCFFLF